VCPAGSTCVLSLPTNLVFSKETKEISENTMGAPQGFDRKELIARIGTFFLLLGIGLLVFFFLSEVAKQTTFEYFCWGLILVILGVMFRNQFKKPAPSSGRFNIVKKLMPKSQKQDQGKK
jgi:hypothetical protein